MLSRVLRNSAAPLTEREHNDLALHFYAIEWHVNRIMDVLNGRARVKWLDVLSKNLRSGSSLFGQLRSALDDDYRPLTSKSPYYGNPAGQDGRRPECPMPGTPKSEAR